jgi:hypothetical protein
VNDISKNDANEGVIPPSAKGFIRRQSQEVLDSLTNDPPLAHLGLHQVVAQRFLLLGVEPWASRHLEDPALHLRVNWIVPEWS